MSRQAQQPTREQAPPCALCRRRRAFAGGVLCPRCHARPSFTLEEQQRISRVRAARLFGGEPEKAN
jgi:hypothetical protein